MYGEHELMEADGFDAIKMASDDGSRGWLGKRLVASFDSYEVKRPPSRMDICCMSYLCF